MSSVQATLVKKLGLFKLTIWFRVKKNSVIKLVFFSHLGKLFLWARFVTDAFVKDYVADIISLFIVYLIQTSRKAKQ